MRKSRPEPPVLITGGAGFIGCNLADRILSSGRKVIVFDNLSRSGAERNLEWLRRQHAGAFEFHEADIRNRNALRRAMSGVGQVFHFAAQVAVTTSLTDPIEDFEVNTRGTLNLLEAIRGQRNPPGLVFTSTNKVYGDLRDLELHANGTRYEPLNPNLKQQGISEQRPLEFHSPYGCSKGAADQYVLDHARTFKIPATVFRMSCIYGPHQYGNEDQGWVAHFLICALDGLPITLYGDGLQVRDILYIDDLVDAFLLAEDQIEKLSGQAFNIGGGPKNSVSLCELLALIEDLAGREVVKKIHEWRLADQQYYVSDTRRFELLTGWGKNFDVVNGVRRLFHWLADSRGKVAVARGGNPA
jgi:CDP-paratose 2-epimerase